MGKNIVVYSGGADSTMILHDWSSVSNINNPTVAVSISEHSHLANGMLENQRLARNRYLKFAKKSGRIINLVEIKIEVSSFIIEHKESRSLQPIMWMCAVMPMLSEGDRLMFGYIHSDMVWHIKSDLVVAFNGLCRLRGIKAEMVFPIEYQKKYEVLKYLRENNIPDNCWWYCDSVEKGKRKPCGVCSKCREIEMARYEEAMLEVQ